jgi:hypothetical protein
VKTQNGVFRHTIHKQQRISLRQGKSDNPENEKGEDGKKEKDKIHFALPHGTKQHVQGYNQSGKIKAGKPVARHAQNGYGQKA